MIDFACSRRLPMIARRSCCAALFGALLAPAAAVAQEAAPPAERYKLRVEYREYRPSVTGTVQHGNGDTAGTAIELDDDLGIGVETQRTWEVHGAIQFRPGHKLRVGYTNIDYDGTVEARRSFVFGSTRFERFSDVITNVKGAYWSAEYEYDVWKSAHGFFGVLAGAKLLDIDWTVVSPPAQREADTTRAPVPSLGATARIYAGKHLSIDGELSGLSFGTYGSAMEAQTSARLHLSDRLALQGGYRRIKLKSEDGLLDSGEATFSGWTFGLELSL
jgi:hypothetical protein